MHEYTYKVNFYDPLVVTQQSALSEKTFFSSYHYRQHFHVVIITDRLQSNMNEVMRAYILNLLF